MVWFDSTHCAGARGSGLSLHCRRQYQAWALGRASVEELEVTFGRFDLSEAFKEGIHFWGDSYYQIVDKTVFFGVSC